MLLLRRLTLRQLEIFSLAATNLNFARTAEELHLTQPAVSMQIKKLEDTLQTPVFERDGRNISLTEAGKKFKYHALRLLDEINNAEQTIYSLKGLSTGQVRVGLVTTATYFGSKLIAEFSKQWPDIEIQLTVSNRKILLAHLKENEIDLVIMGRIPEDIGAEAIAIAPNPHVLVAPASHSLANKDVIKITDLSDDTFLMRESGSGTRTVMEEYFKNLNFTPKHMLTLGSNETVKQGVIAGLGISILSVQSIKLESKTNSLSILSAENTPITRIWHIANNRQKILSPAVKAFRQFVVDEGHSMMEKELGQI